MVSYTARERLLMWVGRLVSGSVSRVVAELKAENARLRKHTDFLERRLDEVRGELLASVAREAELDIEVGELSRLLDAGSGVYLEDEEEDGGDDVRVRQEMDRLLDDVLLGDGRN